jgi:Phosphodiester glycosidase
MDNLAPEVLLRLIKRPGSNQWGKQDRMWSEAALGEDDAGRILFIFSRTPFSMQDLNEELLAAGIGVVAAQHLEGGPEAQLYVRAGSFKLEQFGSYETLFRENDSNATPWPIPNILGVRPRQPSLQQWDSAHWRP